MKPKIHLLQKEQLSDYISAIAWSPQNNTLAACSAKGELILSQPNTALVYLHRERDVSLNGLGFSSQGEFLATAGQNGILEVWQIKDDSPQLIFQQQYPSVWIDTLTWHPQKALLAYGVGREVYILSLLDQTIYARFSFQNSSVLSLAWHPQGNYLAVGGHGGVKIWSLNDREAPPQLLEVPGASLSVAWSQEGRYLASGNLDRTLTILEWEAPPPWLMQGFPGKVPQVVWGNSTSPLVAAACTNGITLWWRNQTDQQWQNSVLDPHQGFVKDFCFHPQQPFLVSAGNDGKIVLSQLKSMKTKTLITAKSGFSRLSWHPQGNYLAAGTSTGELFIGEFFLQGKKGFG